uniref:glutathione transferase n=1 Tax=Graphocephala atropunctata TaxID=36148 RepID=A0A1B6LLB9_9HEMI
MAPNYKLTYFDFKAVAEPIRYLLSYLDEEFQDIRIKLDDWEGSTTKSKATSIAYGKLPLLEVDGKVLTQSVAICRFLAKKAKLMGADDWENVQIDIIADTIVDLRLHTPKIYFEPDEDLKKTKMETYINETIPFYFEKFDALVKENGGYLASKKLSWVDIFFAAMSEFLAGFCKVPDVTANFPNLHALAEKVFNLPQIKKWRASRPQTIY